MCIWFQAELYVCTKFVAMDWKSLLVLICLGTSACVHGGSLKWLVIGDWGGLPDFPYRTAIEKAVSLKMASVARNISASFVMALGDNFYFDGVRSVSDPRFQETFEDVYVDPALHVPWYLVAGNHDHNGNVSAQLAYSRHSKRWNFPNYYYSVIKTIPSTTTTIELIMIDTVLLCGNGDDRLDSQPHGPENIPYAEKQWEWIAQSIANSKADYVIVAGHYPVYSVAEHGPTSTLVERLMPLLHKYNATAYFCGHDHNLQHLQHIEYGNVVDYFVSGAANFVDPSLEHIHNIPPGALKFHWADTFVLGGFSYVEATQQSMTFTFVQANGKELYKQTMYPKKKKVPTATLR